MANAKFGTPVSIMPLNTTVSPTSTGRPSTVNRMPPSIWMLSPVAVTTMSAFSSRPDVSRMPVRVKVSIRSVTIEALPLDMALKMSPSGTMQTRWSHGSYAGLKCVSTGKPAGSCAWR